jgi:hypothetical protein
MSNELVAECDRSVNGYCVVLRRYTCTGLTIGKSCRHFTSSKLPKNPCDWNPKENKPSEYITGSYGPTNGCQNETTVRIGSKKVWHLCDSCAALPVFKKYRSRKKLT